MPRGLLNFPAVARAAGFALIAIAIVAAALHFRASAPHGQALQVGPAAASDLLAVELQRCQLVATQAKDDTACEAAWAENRHRFFTYPTAGSAASPPAASPKSFSR
jgi:conjugative transfer region protein TrbK